MSEDWSTELVEIIKIRQQQRFQIEKALQAFCENLYRCFEEELINLRANGLGEVFSEAKREIVSHEIQRLVFNVDDFELIFIPLNFVAYEETKSIQTYLGDVLTGRLLVFPYNKPEDSPIYSYWINMNGDCMGQGIASLLLCNVHDLGTIRGHVQDFLKEMSTEVKPIWNPKDTIVLGNLQEVSGSSKSPLGFVFSSR